MNDDIKEKRPTPPTTNDDAPVKKAHVEEEEEEEFSESEASDSCDSLPNNGIWLYVKKVKSAIATWIPHLVMRWFHVDPRELKSLIDEYTFFMSIKLFLSKCNAEYTISPPPKIDDVWHLHILDTRYYAYFCNALEHEFHHSLDDAYDRVEQKKRLELYMEIYGVVFGRRPSHWILNYEARNQYEETEKKTAIKIVVESFFDGTKTIYSVFPRNTIYELKCMIYGRKNIPTYLQNITFDNRFLEDDEILGDNNIVADSIVLVREMQIGC